MARPFRIASLTPMPPQFLYDLAGHLNRDAAEARGWKLRVADSGRLTLG